MGGDGRLIRRRRLQAERTGSHARSRRNRRLHRVQTHRATSWGGVRLITDSTTMASSRSRLLKKSRRLRFGGRSPHLRVGRPRLARSPSAHPGLKELKMDSNATIDRLAIRDLIENWALWRDAGDWARFATLWADDSRCSATWFQGSGQDFIRVTIEGWNKGRTPTPLYAHCRAWLQGGSSRWGFAPQGIHKQ
jgi:hypothetical protein